MAAHTKHGYKGHHTKGADKGTPHHRLMAQHTGQMPAAPTAPMAPPMAAPPPMAGGAPPMGGAPPGGGADQAEAQTEDEGAS